MKIAPLPGTGIDKTTGRVISGWDHTLQSISVIFTTFFGERVLIRWFGSFAPKLLGENMDPPTVLRFWTAICIGLDTWEPRFKVTKITPFGNPEDMRTGTLGFQVEGIYRPRAHLGDFTAEGAKKALIFRGADGTAYARAA